MKKQFYSGVAIVLMGLTANAQSKIKDGTVSESSSLPNASALLETESANKGTADKAGMMVYNNNVAIMGTTDVPVAERLQLIEQVLTKSQQGIEINNKDSFTLRGQVYEMLSLHRI